jgi:transcriptional regulator with XRE-family HTH domain
MHFDLASADEIAQEIGERIRAHRLALNLSQIELAARAGISPRTLRNIETNGQGMFDSIIRVAIALGIAGQMSALFELRPRSIKAMEAASAKRQRASRSKT